MRQVLAFFLAASLTLPNPALALRQTGLEEQTDNQGKPVGPKAELVAALRASLATVTVSLGRPKTPILSAGMEEEVLKKLEDLFEKANDLLNQENWKGLKTLMKRVDKIIDKLNPSQLEDPEVQVWLEELDLLRFETLAYTLPKSAKRRVGKLYESDLYDILRVGNRLLKRDIDPDENLNKTLILTLQGWALFQLVTADRLPRSSAERMLANPEIPRPMSLNLLASLYANLYQTAIGESEATDLRKKTIAVGLLGAKVFDPSVDRTEGIYRNTREILIEALIPGPFLNVANLRDKADEILRSQLERLRFRSDADEWSLVMDVLKPDERAILEMDSIAAHVLAEVARVLKVEPLALSLGGVANFF